MSEEHTDDVAPSLRIGAYYDTTMPVEERITKLEAHIAELAMCLDGDLKGIARLKGKIRELRKMAPSCVQPKILSEEPKGGALRGTNDSRA